MCKVILSGCEHLPIAKPYINLRLQNFGFFINYSAWNHIFALIVQLASYLLIEIISNWQQNPHYLRSPDSLHSLFFWSDLTIKL